MNNSDPRVIVYLFGNGANSQVTDKEGNNIFHLCILHSDTSIMGQLLKFCQKNQDHNGVLLIDSMNDEGTNSFFTLSPKI